MSRLSRPGQWSGISGFTLIELIIVITIIAVLAAVALPRLIETQRDARVAKVNAIYGALRSAMALARAHGELELAGTAPSGGAADMNRAADGLVASDGKATNSLDIVVPSRGFEVSGGRAPNCRVTYLEAALNGGVVVAPELSVATDGC